MRMALAKDDSPKTQSMAPQRVPISVVIITSIMQQRHVFNLESLNL